MKDWKDPRTTAALVNDIFDLSMRIAREERRGAGADAELLADALECIATLGAGMDIATHMRSLRKEKEAAEDARVEP